MIANETIEYKGFKAIVQFSAEDECLVGRVLGIRDIIGFHGESVTDIRAAFEEAIDGYLESNERIGREPNTPAEYAPVALDSALYQAAKGRVHGTAQTVDDFVNTAVQQALSQHA